MAGSSLIEVRLAGALATFMIGADDDASTVENMDVEIALDDGSRWSATLLTLAEIRRVMDRWKVAGECLSGSYFQCADLVVVERGGIVAAAGLLDRLVATGQIREALVLIDVEE